MGGAIVTIENRIFQNEIEEAAYRYQREIDNKERIRVGLNEYKSNEAVKIETLKVDPEVEEKQVRRLLETRDKRDGSRVKGCLAALRQAATSGQNVIPAICDAVKDYATVGEICNTLKEVYGEYKEVL